jgi:tripartite ATP-independent transporter DctM subunit
MFEIGLLVFIMIIFLLAGVPIGFTLFLAGLVGVGYLLPQSQFISAPNIAFFSTNSWVLIAVPLFVLMGEFLLRAEMISQSYDAIQTWLGRMRGGLANVNVILSALIAAMTGSSVACAAVVGSASIPEMKKRKYSSALSCGSVASGGTLGILIPPSIALIIYSTYASESVGVLFMAGVIPGIILTLLFLFVISIWARLNPKIAPLEDVPFSFRIAMRKTVGILPIILIILCVLGGIYGGIVTPTEAGAIGCASTLTIGLFKRTLGWKRITEALLATVRVTSMIFLIFTGANMLNYVFAYLGVIEHFTKWIVNSGLSPLAIVIGIYIVYFVLGCFFDGVSMMIITLPFFIPILKTFGYDLVWFGIVLVIVIEMGLVTPPVGLNLFVIHGIAQDVKIKTIIGGTFPFLAMMAVMVTLLTAFPKIALWLPYFLMR